MGKDVEFVVNQMAKTILVNESYFSELDGVVGDGDFGYSLARGFEKVITEWDDIDHSAPGIFLKAVAQLLLGAVGGVSGSIWGTVFLRAGVTISDKTEITKTDVIAMLRAAIEGIKKRGNCDLGDKTYLDTLVPTVNALEKAFCDGKTSVEALDIAAHVASESAEATRNMLAKRGRASYTGERSIGTLDAGSVAVAKIINDLSMAWRE